MRTIRIQQLQPYCRLTLTVICLLAVLTPANAIQLPSFSLRRADCVTVAGLRWYTDYKSACDAAQCEQKMLLVNFLPRGKSDAQHALESYLKTNGEVRDQLQDFVLVRLPRDARVGGRIIAMRKKRGRLIDDPAFKHLGRSPGLAIVDYKHTENRYYGKVVTALPYKDGKYYRWENSHLAVALGLPAGTVTQRTMIWAVRTHPEAPQSTVGKLHPALAAAAARQSAYQASIGVQGHQNWETRFHQVVARTHAGSAREVVAESWENQDLIDSAIDCVQSWRQSPGHWSAVSSRHRYFGYDIRRGKNGIWYGTGIFAN